MIRFLLVSLITVYQKIVSPSTGLPYTLGFVKAPVCRFLPTCSQYTKEAIQKHGVVKGISLGVKRISRCRPGLPPEYDPIPESL